MPNSNQNAGKPVQESRNVYSEVLAGLNDAADPLEFIKSNIRANEQTRASNGVAPAAPAPVPAAEAVAVVAPAPAQPTFKDESVGELPLSVAPGDAKPQDPVAPAAEGGEDPAAQTPAGPEQSIKDLRKKANEYKTQLTEAQESLRTVAEELERYKKGEAIPETLKEKDDRIAALEHYERLHGFRLSPEYQKKYVEPLEQLKTKAVQLAQDYQVEVEVLDEALALTNKKDLNSFLRNYFDDVGALEVREVLTKIREIDNEAKEAEKEPEKSFQNLKDSYANEQREQESLRIGNITANSRDGWIAALQEVRAEETYPELILTGDIEADKIARPIVESAAQEYGKFVKLLVGLGAKELPKDVAKILAKRFQLSQASSVIAESRAHHYQRSQEIIRENERQAAMIRPPVGSATGGGIVPAPVKPASPEAAAEQILDKVLRRKSA